MNLAAAPKAISSFMDATRLSPFEQLEALTPSYSLLDSSLQLSPSNISCRTYFVLRGFDVWSLPQASARVHVHPQLRTPSIFATAFLNLMRCWTRMFASINAIGSTLNIRPYPVRRYKSHTDRSRRSRAWTARRADLSVPHKSDLRIICAQAPASPVSEG